MAKRVELTWKQHADLKVDPNAAIKAAQDQHIINLRVNELGKASSSFPVFFTKAQKNGDWALAAITSLQIGSNLDVQNEQWLALYTPTRLQTYPFFLMQSDRDDGSLVVGIEQDDTAFSYEQGEPLFASENTAGPRLSRAAVQLQNDLQADIQTKQFIEFLVDKNILEEVAILVKYKSGTVNSLKGVFTVNELLLAKLSDADFLLMKEKGYLPAIYSQLGSLFQLNRLLFRHNEVFTDNLLEQVGVNRLDENEQPAKQEQH